MSAIFGILDTKGRALDEAWTASMQADLIHRGPDGQGIYREESIALGNMLLQVTPESVYDLSPFEEDGLVITANARLDERDILMDHLNIPAADREKTTDPMLLLRSYRKWGNAFVKDIYGDFSFAIWNKQKKELFCARDQMGVKPLLYYYEDGRFVFSTELKAVVKLPFVKTHIDKSYLTDRAVGIAENPNNTAWENITRLSAAHTLFLTASTITITQYWEPVYRQNPLYKTAAQSATALLQVLQRVIADHTRVTGTVGVPLSGGLDSTTIACLAARKMALAGKNIVTASSVLDPEYSEPGVTDEMEYIQSVLQQEKNIDPTFVYNTDLQWLTGIDKTFNRHYAPVNNFYYVDEALLQKFKLKSVRRILSGYLGDMTTSNRSITPLTHLLLNRQFSTLFRLGNSMQQQSGQHWLSFLKANLIVPLLPMFLLKAGYKLKKKLPPWDISRLPLLISPGQKKILQKRKISYHKSFLSYQNDVRRSIFPSPIEFFGEDWDCCSAHLNTEFTYPLFDRRIVELLLQLPAAHFYADGLKRGLIRKTMKKILPEKIRSRQDKNAYSPAYHQIVKKNLLKADDLFKNELYDTNFLEIIDKKNINCQLENLVLSKTSYNFTGNYFSILNMINCIAFENWVIKKNVGNLYEKRNKKKVE